MLVLSRKRTESIKIGDDILIKVIHTSRGTVKLGIEAPAHIRVLRAELTEFRDTPAPITSGNSVIVNFETDNSSDSVSPVECYANFHLDHVVEVEDLMLCVGVH